MRAIYSAEQDLAFLHEALTAFGKTDSYSTIGLVDLLHIDIYDAWRLLIDWERAGYVGQVESETATQGRYRQWVFTAKAEGATKRVYLAHPHQVRAQRE